MKSLLELLMEEDDAVKEYNRYEADIRQLAEAGVPEKALADRRVMAEDARKKADMIRNRIRHYFSSALRC